MRRRKTVADDIAGATHWQTQFTSLRQILRSTALDETVKWGAPCYTNDGNHRIAVGAFKSCFGLWSLSIGKILPMIAAGQGLNDRYRR